MTTFDPPRNLSHIVLVGTGGTGAQLARALARILYDMQRRNLHTPSFTLIDPDIVDDSNVGRQMFTVNDVGQPKAEVLMRRFNLALGLRIRAICAPFNAHQHLEQSYNTLLIGAVDNHAARQELARAKNFLWLDTGNHQTAGQVVLGNSDSRAYSDYKIYSDNSYQQLPNAATIFPDLLKPPPETQSAGLSCAQLTELGSQHLLINDLVATTAAGYVYRILHRQPISTWISFVSIDGPSIRSIPVDPAELEHYLDAARMSKRAKKGRAV